MRKEMNKQMNIEHPPVGLSFIRCFKVHALRSFKPPGARCNQFGASDSIRHLEVRGFVLPLAASVVWRSLMSPEACCEGWDGQQCLWSPCGPLLCDPACKDCAISSVDLVFLPLEWRQAERFGFVFMSVAMQTSLLFRFSLFFLLFINITCIPSSILFSWSCSTP